MKIDFNKRYNTIAFYAVLVITVSALFLMGISKLDLVASFFSKAMVVLRPFIWGFSIAYILNPLMTSCERFLSWLTKDRIRPKPRRYLATLLAYLLSLTILVIFFRIVIPQIFQSLTTLGEQIPGWLEQLRILAMDLINRYELENLPTTTIDKLILTVENLAQTFTAKLTTMLPQVLQATVNFTAGLFNILVGIIISVYLLTTKEQFFAQIKKLLSALFSQERVKRATAITHKSHAVFSGFITGKLLDSLIIGLLCLVFMKIFRWPYAMLISVIVGVTNIIPYFGPFFGAIPSILILLIVDPMTALWFGIFVLMLQQLDGNIIGPKILGDSTGLSPFWVIFSITVFGSLMGVVGMFIGVPLFAVIYSLVGEFMTWRLETRSLSTKTVDYASPEHQLFPEKVKPPKKKRS